MDEWQKTILPDCETRGQVAARCLFYVSEYSS